jgi:AraC-like DNA-binding protein
VGECPEEGEWLGILLKPGVFLPHLPARTLVDTEVHLPTVSPTSFWLSGFTWPFPDYDNADTCVAWLVHRGLLAHEPIVEAVFRGQVTNRDPRTIQRRVLRATGLTQCAIHQIERARYATQLLQQGVSILDTVEYAGYFDQSHLTRSLGRLIGQTPGQIREKSRPEQMPFFYKTASFERVILSAEDTEQRRTQT